MTFVIRIVLLVWQHISRQPPPMKDIGQYFLLPLLPFVQVDMCKGSITTSCEDVRGVCARTFLHLSLIFMLFQADKISLHPYCRTCIYFSILMNCVGENIFCIIEVLEIFWRVCGVYGENTCLNYFDNNSSNL